MRSFPIHRCTADHQRDAQYPFLDEQVVAYLQALPMTVKVTALWHLHMYTPIDCQGYSIMPPHVCTPIDCQGYSIIQPHARVHSHRLSKLYGTTHAYSIHNLHAINDINYLE